MTLPFAVVGFGGRGRHLAEHLLRGEPTARLALIIDPNVDQARAQLRDLPGANENVPVEPDLTALEARAGELSGIIVATRCSSHTPIALSLRPLGLPILLEKPVAVNRAQVAELAAGFAGFENRVIVSFPLRFSPTLRAVREIIDSGRLGTINQIQAINYVPYGGVYFGAWYRDGDETGDLWLQKATHDLDAINLLVGEPPVRILAAETRRVYGGDMPEGLTCSACPRTAECPESPPNQAARDNTGGMPKGDHACAFARDITHHDGASAIVHYADGTLVTYTQNFLSRRSAGRRGAIITGYLATLEFDFPTYTVRVIEHHGTKVETIEPGPKGTHFGGDRELLRNFVEVMRGEAPSQAPLQTGLLSATMCLAAGESCRSGAAVDIAPPTFPTPHAPPAARMATATPS